MTSGTSRFLKRLLAWGALPRSDKWLALELVFELARARFQVSFVPFRVFARDLGPPEIAIGHVVAGEPDPDPDTLRLIRVVQALTESLSALLPWKCTCLVQALAVLRVLRRGGCRTNLCLGVHLAPSEMEAHAWLSHGSRIITGRSAASGFSPLALFRG